MSTQIYALIGVLLYLPGYIWGWKTYVKWALKDHQMAWSASYRMTDAYAPGTINAVFWPIMLVGVGVRRLWQRRADSKQKDA